MAPGQGSTEFVSVFQLGLFLMALRPARTSVRPARFARALPELQKKKKYIIYFYFVQNKIFFFCVFSDSRCKNACKMLADLCPCFHQSPTRPNFGHSRVKVCRFCVVCALNCARILVVRALDCAQFILHPALFPT